jgi:hypothetical protein
MLRSKNKITTVRFTLGTKHTHNKKNINNMTTKNRYREDKNMKNNTKYG